MSKRKVFSIILLSVMLCGICLIAAGCPDKEKDKKYDATFRVVCREVISKYSLGPIIEEYIFTSDINEMHIEREYDGKQYDYYLYEYNLPNHPRWSEKWFGPVSEGDMWVYHNLTFEGQIYGEESPKYVGERKNYIISIGLESSIINYRNVYLYVNVV